MSNVIVLLDPSLAPSVNTGNEIIIKSIRKVLNSLFPSTEILSLSPFQPFTKKDRVLINSARYCFAGGANMLTSNVRHFSLLVPEKVKGFYLFPGFSNVVLLGTGWGAYEPPPDWATRLFYRKILHRNILNSVRDDYSKDHLKHAGIANVLNTSCPSTWDLKPYVAHAEKRNASPILFTLTDYAPNRSLDNGLVNAAIAATTATIYFFPQGPGDIAYLQSLPEYERNKERFEFLPPSLKALEDFLSGGRVCYFGTRLHCGILCMQYRMETCIVAIDNRATEMARGTGLPVINRQDVRALEAWSRNEYTAPALTLPQDAVDRWKNQFLS